MSPKSIGGRPKVLGQCLPHRARNLRGRRIHPGAWQAKVARSKFRAPLAPAVAAIVASGEGPGHCRSDVCRNERRTVHDGTTLCAHALARKSGIALARAALQCEMSPTISTNCVLRHTHRQERERERGTPRSDATPMPCFDLASALCRIVQMAPTSESAQVWSK